VVVNLPVADQHKIECANCYGNGCFVCGGRGWTESEVGMLEREDAEERIAEERAEMRRIYGDDA
jgi:hypothetical protein